LSSPFAGLAKSNKVVFANLVRWVNMMTIGARLKLIRTKFKLSLEKTGVLFDVTAQTLSRYENGKRTPDNDFLESFGKHFKLSGDWLLYGAPPIFKASDLDKDVKEAFVELSSLLSTKGSHKDIIPEVLRVSMEKLTEDTPENFIMMLEYMLKDEAVRKDMFQFFHLFQKPPADKRMETLENDRY
jgi:transcriptional regulator with XRE-family HTH domain